MTISARDKKILMLLVPVLVVAAYWFLVLTPKREEAAKLGDTLAAAESRRDTAVAALGQAEATKSNYAEDYATVVRLGKAIPSDVDMPSLLIQLDRAADGTNIRFAKIEAGARTVAPVTAPAPAADGSIPDAAPVDAGGAEATSGPGQATESANESVAAANGSSAASTDAAGNPIVPAATTTPTALDTVPLTFSFDGRFADLADFFHEMKRFVRVANDRVQVNGRLMKIDGFTFDSSDFPTITASVTATVYLAPKAQGATAGATPEGPAPATTPAANTSAPTPAPATPVAEGATQ